MSMYKSTHSFPDRQALAEEFRKTFPNKVPVVVERAPSARIGNDKVKRFLVPYECSFGHLYCIVRKQLRLRPEVSLILYVKDVIPAPSMTIGALYHTHHDDDYLLYVTYQDENVYGGGKPSKGNSDDAAKSPVVYDHPEDDIPLLDVCSSVASFIESDSSPEEASGGDYVNGFRPARSSSRYTVNIPLELIDDMSRIQQRLANSRRQIAGASGQTTSEVASEQQGTSGVAREQQGTPVGPREEQGTSEVATEEQSTSEEETGEQGISKEVTEQTGPSEEVTEQTSTSEEVTEQTSTSEEFTEQTSTSEGPTEQQGTSEGPTEQQGTSEGPVEQQDTTEATTGQRGTPERSSKQQSTSERVSDQGPTRDFEQGTTEGTTKRKQTEEGACAKDAAEGPSRQGGSNPESEQVPTKRACDNPSLFESSSSQSEASSEESQDEWASRREFAQMATGQDQSEGDCIEFPNGASGVERAEEAISLELFEESSV